MNPGPRCIPVAVRVVVSSSPLSRSHVSRRAPGPAPHIPPTQPALYLHTHLHAADLDSPTLRGVIRTAS